MTRIYISVAVNYRYRQYKSIWKFRSIIDMDFSISIYGVSNLTSPIMGYQPPAVAPSTWSPSENKGTLAGTRQLKRISKQKDTSSCHSSHLLCLFKRFNRHERPMLSQSELLGPIPETIQSLWKSDRITNLSSAGDFSIRSDSTIDPAVIGSWSWRPARYVDRCWIRNFNTTIGHFISNITIVKFHKLPGNIVCLVSTVCIFSMTLITYTHLSNIACPNRVVSWANTVCVQWTGHDALVSALINDVATPLIVTSWIDIISLTFFIQSQISQWMI